LRLGPTELVIILAIVILLFGVGRVSRVGGELGTAIRQFRRGLSEETDDDAVETEGTGQDT
jgi:sec-independent protein translocase protein TatA